MCIRECLCGRGAPVTLRATCTCAPLKPAPLSVSYRGIKKAPRRLSRLRQRPQRWPPKRGRKEGSRRQWACQLRPLLPGPGPG
jgi:hypothetical protein